MSKKYIKLLESELEKAEITLAVRDVSDTLQKMASDISRTTVDDIPAVVERIKATHGVAVGNKFSQSITDQLNELVQQILATKSNIDDEALVIAGDATEMDLEQNDMTVDVMDDPIEDNDLGVDSEDEDDLELDLDLDVSDEPELGRKVKESKEYSEDGRGKFKVTYTNPDKKNVGNDRFETKAEAVKFKKDLEKKGYHDVVIGESSSYPISVRKLLEKCDSKKKKIVESMYNSGPKQRKKVFELAKKLKGK